MAQRFCAATVDDETADGRRDLWRAAEPLLFALEERMFRGLRDTPAPPHLIDRARELDCPPRLRWSVFDLHNALLDRLQVGAPGTPKPQLGGIATPAARNAAA